MVPGEPTKPMILSGLCDQPRRDHRSDPDHRAGVGRLPGGVVYPSSDACGSKGWGWGRSIGLRISRLLELVEVEVAADCFLPRARVVAAEPVPLGKLRIVRRTRLRRRRPPLHPPTAARRSRPRSGSHRRRRARSAPRRRGSRRRSGRDQGPCPGPAGRGRRGARSRSAAPRARRRRTGRRGSHRRPGARRARARAARSAPGRPPSASCCTTIACAM